MTQRLTIIPLLLAIATLATAQADLKTQLQKYFTNYSLPTQLIRSKAHLESLDINDSLKTVTVTADTHFGEQTFTPASTTAIYKAVGQLLPDTLKDYRLTVVTGGWPIEELVAPRLRQQGEDGRTWGNIDYKGRPWVDNASRPYHINKGLYNRHL